MSDIRYKVLWRTTDGEDLIIQISPAFFEMIRNWWNSSYPKTWFNGSSPRSTNWVWQSASDWSKPYSPRVWQAPRTTWYAPRGSSQSRDWSRDRQWGWPRKPREYIRRWRWSEIKL